MLYTLHRIIRFILKIQDFSSMRKLAVSNRELVALMLKSGSFVVHPETFFAGLEKTFYIEVLGYS